MPDVRGTRMTALPVVIAIGRYPVEIARRWRLGSRQRLVRGERPTPGLNHCGILRMSVKSKQPGSMESDCPMMGAGMAKRRDNPALLFAVSGGTRRRRTRIDGRKKPNSRRRARRDTCGLPGMPPHMSRPLLPWLWIHGRRPLHDLHHWAASASALHVGDQPSRFEGSEPVAGLVP